MPPASIYLSGCRSSAVAYWPPTLFMGWVHQEALLPSSPALLHHFFVCSPYVCARGHSIDVCVPNCSFARAASSLLGGGPAHLSAF